MPKVTGAVRREDTVLRLGGYGDNWHMSWAADDRQFVSLDDGFGWGQEEVFHNSRMLTVSGDPENAKFEDLPGYPDLTFNLSDPDTWFRYYGFGTLALNERVYQFLSTPNHGLDQRRGARFVGAKLIYSPDNGATWCNQDGSTPVAWEHWDERSKENMAFFEEPGEAFSLLTVLQMGRNYEANKDGYVYVYAPNGNVEGTMNQLVMFRVPKESLLDRGAYEFFAGLDAEGSASWSKAIEDRGIVHTFPSGWVNVNGHPYAWQPSVVYNEPLGVYLMANWGMGCTEDGEWWFGKPSYLGLWTAPNPWGPWTQIHEETAWEPDQDPGARAYQPQISPKWIAADGRSFWLVWTDYQVVGGTSDADHDELAFAEVRSNGGSVPMELFTKDAEAKPYYSFNAQRVDLIVE
jgi:hypothetical protein